MLPHKLIFLLSSVIYSLNTYIFFHIFKFDRRVPRVLESFTFVLQIVAVNSMDFLELASVNKLIVNLVLFFIISLNYNISILRRVFTVILLTAIFLVSESLFLLPMHKISFNIFSVVRLEKGIWILLSDIMVLGNIMDNAINANKLISKEERYINIDVEYSKGTLIIKENNPISGKRSESLIEDRISNGSGIGIKSIKSSVDNYGGDMIIDYSDNMFSINIILYEN